MLGWPSLLSLKTAFTLVALGALASGCTGSAPSATFDLTAPSGFGQVAGGRSHLVVAEPTTVQALDSDRIIVREAAGAISFLGGAQWADRMPRLVQTRLIQTFENGSRLGAVGRPGERIVPDLQLNTDVRSFSVDSGTREVVVEISAKLVNDRSGKVRAARLFVSRLPLSSVEGPAAAQTLDRALSLVLVDIVRWAGRS
ncbi:MAG: ABC-type transport auxiliary lipoprotein family protein [Bosea sp. (in: a-proteobacteria)]